MDTHAHSHLVFPKFEVCNTFFRNDTRCQCKAYGTCVVFCFLCCCIHFIQSAHCTSLCAGCFIHEENTCYTTTYIYIRTAVYIISANDAACLDVIHLTTLRSIIKYHDISCIISVKIQNACACFYFFCNIIDLLSGRRLEHAADTAAIQHTVSNITQEQRKMSVAAACNDGNLARNLLCSTITSQITGCTFYHIAMYGINAFQHIVCIILSLIHNLFHVNNPPFFVQSFFSCNRFFHAIAFFVQSFSCTHSFICSPFCFPLLS